jgi:hypothetical protein
MWPPLGQHNLIYTLSCDAFSQIHSSLLRQPSHPNFRIQCPLALTNAQNSPISIHRMNKLLSIAALIWLSASCTTITVDPEAVIPTVSYKNDVAPIIAANCGQSGCHGTDRTEQFNLLSYSALSKLATPNEPHNSDLYNVIRKYDAGAMPPSPNNPLSDVQIGQIYVWILQGATDN